MTPDLPPTLSLALPHDPEVTLDLVLVRPGRFWMGSEEEDEEAYDDEMPRHQVEITRPYYMAKLALTQGQWSAVSAGNAPDLFRGKERPVDSISWNDLMIGDEKKSIPAFLATCQQKIGRPEEVKDWQFRLPTEAEWEYAARGGHLAAEPYPHYPGSQEVDSVAWTSRNSFASTRTVGKLRPNALGLYDLEGNVLEWCADGFRGYGESQDREVTRDPFGEVEGEHSSRVLRGGSWFFTSRNARSAYRTGNPPGDRDESVGCRLVLAPVRASER